MAKITPLLLGVGGDSGTGKSTFVGGIYERDAWRRGYSIEQVMQEIEARQEDIREHIEPQKEYSDFIIRFYPPDGPWNPEDNAHLNVRLFLSRNLPKSGMDELLKEAMGRKTRRAVRLVDEDYYGQPFHTMEIDGSIHPQTAAGLEQRIWAHLLSPMKLIQDLAPDQIGSFAEGNTSGHSDPLVLVQLLAIYYLLHAREARQTVPQEGLAEMSGG